MILGGVVTKGNVINFTKKFFQNVHSRTISAEKLTFCGIGSVILSLLKPLTSEVGHGDILRGGVQIFTFEYIERYTFKIFYKRNTEDETYIRVFLGSADFTLFKQ